MKLKSKEIRLKGFPICRGIAIGKPFFFTYIEESVPEHTISSQNIEDEIDRYRDALSRGRDDVKRLQRKLQNEDILEGAAILEAQLQMMQDPLLTTFIENEIRLSKKNAEYVFHHVIKRYQEKFNSFSDPYFRERFKDIQDISRRVMAYLSADTLVSLGNIPPNSIIFARELTASDAAEADLSVNAFITETGSSTTHAAIVAKAKGIPYVTNIDFDRLGHGFHEQKVIVDGRTGEIIVNPTEDTLKKFEKLRQQLDGHLTRLSNTGSLKSETYDGYQVRLSANIEVADELEMLHRYGGGGVGLFRSEYLFLAKECFPTEEEQFLIYKDIVEKMRGLPIVIRTFDVGGDKYLGDDHPFEGNPFLGCRAIRFLLREKEIFRTQLRAILRASAFGDVRLMFPMVSALPELIEAKKIVKEVRQELEAKKIPIGKHIKIGCMIEVPSAAIISDLLAKECDFLSIGTNDLVQYALAVDRGNLAMSSLYTPTHPSVMRLIKLIVSEANKQGIPVTVCGEVAADPRFTPLLLGLGVHELSVALRYIPIVKNAIRHTSIVEASRIAERAMQLTTAEEIQALLDEEYKKSNPEDYFYNF